ncbi:MAG: hypothetical protein BSR46_16110 [Candidatus Dactylopiibacterium carminicum]|nr:MAG: hypothetical protein BSR46_16110 [Candidatus Dactylopiibacterium carminicum]
MRWLGSHLSAPTLYLVRHPPVAVPSGFCYGRSDVPLAAPVAPIAADLLTRLPPEFRVLSSPLSRCLQLAQALGDAQVDADLMEIDFGRWEMRHWDTIGREALDAWAAAPLDYREHGGESVRQMAARTQAALQRARAEATLPLVIVSHAGPLRAMTGLLRDLPATEWLQWPVAHAPALQEFPADIR